MKIISYNVNGYRSALSKGLLDWVREADPDVLCLQEIKAGREPLDVSGFEALGYHAYLHPAQKPGYSGVATFTKQQPNAVHTGCGTDLYDCEGRVLQLDFDDCAVLNVYMPSGTSSPERQQFKLDWLAFFADYVARRRPDSPPLVIGGDFNLCHQDIDLHNPKANQNTPGFTPGERAWMGSFLGSGFTDSFRHHHGPATGHYSWWTFRAGARARNVGWRLDYLLLDERLQPRLAGAGLLRDVVHSDHCPAFVELG
ncbi:exodeoxyribonuclease III [Hymenobacter sp. BT175]|uniref:exodeoxyribonuclease III n=1 Tax=Hymenobacter translucens TaxID=2886507 RepID=UPI001D0F2DB2|nr:exodeoxyribonuclease III [Hymenobacter translucens]MCC2545726.1 exodeoxyribonuclease III [Hymenobacter translucens]